MHGSCGAVGRGGLGVGGVGVRGADAGRPAQREAENLQEQLLEQERQGPAALEAKNAQLESAIAAAETAEQAEAANAAKSEFLANMSHEIRRR